MGGYSNYFIALTSALILSYSITTSDKSKMSLNKIVIKADRGSPAFAAIEDLYSLDDLTQESISNSKQIEKIELKELKPVKLEGVKISLDGDLKKQFKDFENINKANFVKVALLGERIGVRHFTKKFMTSNKSDFKLAKLSDFNPNWGDGRLIASNTVKSKNYPQKIKSQGSRVNSLSSSDQEEIKSAPTRRVVASVAKTTRASNRPAFKTSSVELKRPSFKARKMIRGQLVLKDGAIQPGNGFIYYIERLFDGVVHESGVVNAESGVFEIEVGSAKGVIYSELRNLKGHVLAYGEFNLSDKVDLNEIELSLYPSGEDFSGRTLSYESYDDYEKPVAKAVQTVTGVDGDLVSDREGYFNEQVFEAGSSFVTASHAQDFWSTLSIGVNGKPLYPKLYSKKHIEALSQLADPFGEEIEITSLITGRVTQAGLDQAGIELKLYGAEYHQPLYFDSKIPAPKKTATTNDGRFAFINLIDGDYLVQAYKGERLLNQRWFKVRRNHVSFGQIDLGKKYEVEIEMRTFPDKLKAEGELEIAEFGVELFTKIDNKENISLKLKTNPELTIFQTLSSDNHMAQIIVASTKGKRHEITQVHKEWLDGFLASKRSNANRAMGMVVGFYKNDLKRIVLEASTAKSQASQVFYFDKFGDSVEEPVESGGYIITDVPQGLNTIVFSSRFNSKFTSKLVMSQKSSLSVL